MLVGLPGSGKSTWLARQGIGAISSDWIRQVLADDATDQTIHARVFLTMRYLLRHRLAIGRPVSYVDATHLTPEERRPYIQIAQWYGCDVEALYFDVPAGSVPRKEPAARACSARGSHGAHGYETGAAGDGGRLHEDHHREVIVRQQAGTRLPSLYLAPVS